MILTLDFITNSSSTVEIVFLPRDFRVELEKLLEIWQDINYSDEEPNITEADVDRLNMTLNDYRRNGGEMYADNGGDERTLTYYVRNFLPKEYTVGSCETGDSADSVYVIPREKIKEILQKDLEWVPPEPKE